MNDASLIVSAVRPYGTNNEFELPIKVTASLSSKIPLGVTLQKTLLNAVCTGLLWCPHAVGATAPSWTEDSVTRVFTPNVDGTGSTIENLKADFVITLKNIDSTNDYADVVQIIGNGVSVPNYATEINAYILSAFISVTSATKYAVQSASVHLYE